MNRNTAWQIVTEFVKDAGLRRHMLAVEAAMRWYAATLDDDADQWGLAGLLHDFDWEVHPTLETHPAKGVPILRERGCDETILHAILSHNTPATDVERKDPMDFALLACDEITGLLIAATLVRPSKDIRDMPIKSVKKKWKDKAFAAAINRNHIEQATGDFSTACYHGELDLWTHIGHVLEAMQAGASGLGLDGR